MPDGLTAVALVCTLKPSPAESSSEVLARDVLDALAEHGVTGSIVRVVDHDVRPGVESDMGDGDQWPVIRAQLMAADILLISTPTWMGHPSSICARVLERLDAELSETDEQGRLLTFGKAAAVAVVGNEDGAHKITADVFQALNDVGFSIAAQAGTYWHDVAMGSKDYKDLPEKPAATVSATKTLAANTAHLARLLKASGFPSTS
jgi:multimeric flavodoxin WrbA